jgi:hypothetical protein
MNRRQAISVLGSVALAPFAGERDMLSESLLAAGPVNQAPNNDSAAQIEGVKFLFFDFRDIETVEGFIRKLEPPRKHVSNPLLVSDLASEVNLMMLYGTVIRRPTDGLWQLWYKCYNPNGRGPALGYGESKDGIRWERPALDIVKFKGEKTNIVFDEGPHGTAVLYDEREERPGWRYKMVHGVSGAGRSHRVEAFRSPDGIHWCDACENPILGVVSGGPIGLLRGNDGRYVLYLRPAGGDRRIGRSESWDFVHWSEIKIVLDQEPGDPPQVQFYGMGAATYGGYEIGLPWIYHTVASDLKFGKPEGRMQPELAYARSGYAWHRAAPGHGWISLGDKGSWDHAQSHPASLPVYLEDEIRFYYAAAKQPHEVSTRALKEPQWGLGFASSKPDRFVALAAPGEGRLLTRPFWTATGQFFVNASCAGGELRLEITDLNGKTIPGFDRQGCQPLTGDATRCLVRWQGNPDSTKVADTQIRMRVFAKNAKLYSIFSGTENQAASYWRFRIPSHMPMDKEKASA